MASKAEEKQFENWEEVIVDFFEYRVSDSKLYKAREFIQKKDDQIEKEKDPKKKERLLRIRNKKQEELNKLRNGASRDYIYAWLEKISKKQLDSGKKFIKGTHLLKFSHPSAPPEALILTKGKEEKYILSTSSFKKNLVYDIAHSNGNLITISRFLALSLKGNMIFDLILSGDFSFLDSFASDDKKKQKIQKGLIDMVEKREMKTAEKTKQIYFPLQETAINYEENYHLLIPLFSSSFCEEIYSYIRFITFDKKNREVRDILKKSFSNNNSKPLYRPYTYINVLDTAVLKFGGNQPQNISMLNKNRSWKASPKDKNALGITYLFSCQAPTWHSQLKPPIYRESLFDDLYSSSINSEIDYLRGFLLRFKSLGLSIKDPKRKRHLVRWIENIIDEFLFYVGSIQALPPGWSDTEGIKLKKEHQYLLDPYRPDDTFQKERQSVNWQSTVREDFARWLNARLSGKDKRFTPQAEHTRMWKKLLTDPLREYMENVEYDLKQHHKESV